MKNDTIIQGMMQTMSGAEWSSPMAATLLLVGAATLFAMRNSEASSSLPPKADTSWVESVTAPAKEDFIETLMKWCESVDFAPVFRTSPPVPGLNFFGVCDPKVVREILMDSTTRKPKLIFMPFENNMGTNVFTETDHEKWRPARKGLAPAFASKNVNRMIEVCEKHVHDFITDRLEKLIEKGEDFDPAFETTKLSIGILCDAVLDYAPPAEDMEKFITEFRLFSKDLMAQTLNPLHQIFRQYIPNARRAGEAIQWLRSFAKKFITAYRNNPNPTPGTIIERIVTNEKHYKDDEARISEVFVFMNAGFDTVGYSLAWALLLMAQHPEEQSKVRTELNKMEPKDRASSAVMQNTIRETQRLNAVAATGSPRLLGRDFTIKNGYTKDAPEVVLRKGSIAFCSQVTINRNPYVFPDRPLEFVPSRWTESDPKTLETMKAAVAPYSLGARNCIGQALATAELGTVLSTLLSKYRFEVVADGEPRNLISYRPEGARLRAFRVES